MVGIADAFNTGLQTAGNFYNDRMLREQARIAPKSYDAQLEILQAQAQYAPLLAKAQAASQMAYAQFLPRQIAAQILGNPTLVNAMTKEQLQQVISDSHMGSASNQNMPSMPTATYPTQNRGGLASPSTQFSPNQEFGAVNPASPSEVSFIANNGNRSLRNAGSMASPQPMQGQQTDINAITGNDPKSEMGLATNAWMQSQEAAAMAEKQGMYTIPESSQLLNWYRSKQGKGGLAATPPGIQVNAPQGDFIDRLKQRDALGTSGDIMTGQGKGVGGGTTYIDPQSQEARSSVTPTQATSIQTSLLTSERVEPYIKALPIAYKEIYGLPGLAKRLTQGVVSYATGGNLDTPTLEAYGKFQASLTNAADGFLKELNLNNTTGNRISMQEAIQPVLGENPKNYQARMNWLWKTIQDRDEKGKAALAHGIILNPKGIQSIDGIKDLVKETDKYSMTIELPNSAPMTKVLNYNPKTRRIE